MNSDTKRNDHGHTTGSATVGRIEFGPQDIDRGREDAVKFALAENYEYTRNTNALIERHTKQVQELMAERDEARASRTAMDVQRRSMQRRIANQRLSLRRLNALEVVLAHQVEEFRKIDVKLAAKDATIRECHMQSLHDGMQHQMDCEEIAKLRQLNEMLRKRVEDAEDIINFGAEVWVGKWAARAKKWLECTEYFTCDWCGGSGLALGDNGEPGICPDCKGDTVIRTENEEGSK